MVGGGWGGLGGGPGVFIVNGFFLFLFSLGYDLTSRCSIDLVYRLWDLYIILPKGVLGVVVFHFVGVLWGIGYL